MLMEIKWLDKFFIMLRGNIRSYTTLELLNRCNSFNVFLEESSSHYT